jgi:hypothetical protein
MSVQVVVPVRAPSRRRRMLAMFAGKAIVRRSRNRRCWAPARAAQRADVSPVTLRDE